MKSASRQTSNVNRSASNVNRESNANVNRSGNRVNTGNINTGDINIDVDNGCCDGGWGDNYHPVARGAAIAATTAVVMGSYYNSLPGNCVTVVRGGRQLFPVRVDLVPAGLFRVERAICGGAGALGGDFPSADIPSTLARRLSL